MPNRVFGLTALVVIRLAVTANPSYSQYGEVGLYADDQGTVCSLLDDGGPLTVYIVHKNAVSGAAGSQFRVRPGNGVTLSYLGFNAAPGMLHIGQPHDGITIAYGNCKTGTNWLGSIFYMTYGTSDICSVLEVVDDPISPIPGSVVIVDCSFVARAASSTRAEVNASPECDRPCTGELVATPSIRSIDDVPNDQGKQVSISWWRSGRDELGSPTPITQYGVYRRIDPDLGTTSLSASASSLPAVPRVTPPGNWHFVGAVPARGDDQYALVVPTLKDSTVTDGLYETVFFVSALTAQPLTYFDSPMDSGYSVDNLVPSVPSNLLVAYNTGHGNELSWEPGEPDVQYYRIYRSTSGGESPSQFELVGATASTSWNDPDFDGWPVDYRITAVDFSGNESKQAGPSQPPTGIRNTHASYQLGPNVPNPFSRATVIPYDVPGGGGHVTISAYDVHGKLIRTLMDKWVPGGSGEAAWDGRDQSGKQCASGVYFVRMMSSSAEMVRKIVIAR
jgi:hypothetical protein